MENLPKKYDELEEKTAKIADEIIAEEDIGKIKDLTTLFNMNMSKKNVARLMKLNNLLDSVSDEMQERLNKRSDEFSNSDLISYMTVVQESIEKSNKSLNQVDECPVININNTTNELNIGLGDGLDRQSKEKVLSAVQAYLSRIKSEDNMIVVENTDEDEE